MNKFETTSSPEELTGPRVDFNRIRGGNHREVLTQNKEAQELYDTVVSIINEEKYKMIGSHPEDIITIISIIAQENNWNSYEDINFDIIRKELEANGIPLRERKSPSDFND